MPSAVTRLRLQLRQNGAVVEAMMPKTVPSGRAKRDAGAALSSMTGVIFPIARFERSQHFIARNHFRARPLGGAAHVHVLDEAHFGAVRAAELDEIGKLVVIHAADDDRVEFCSGKAGASARRRIPQARGHARRAATWRENARGAACLG